MFNSKLESPPHNTASGPIMMKSSRFDWAIYLSKMSDLVCPTFAEHQLRTAYIASMIAQEMGLTDHECKELLLAAAIHDIGALSTKERLSCLSFDLDSTQQHAEAGYLLLTNAPMFAATAQIIRHHHVRWQDRTDSNSGNRVFMLSNILNLADRIEITIKKDIPVKSQLQTVRDTILSYREQMFAPQAVDAFIELSYKSFFTFDLESPYLEKTLSMRCELTQTDFDMAALKELAQLFGRIVDFRSRYTALHSAATAEVAAKLASCLNFSDHDIELMKIAGLMHDVGKLAIPNEILEKTGPLNNDEFEIVKKHPYYIRRLLDAFPGLERLNDWVSFHHERMDGSGYPFGIAGPKIPMGARILSVADVFVALTEDRPYRKSMSSGKAVDIIKKMAAEGALDIDVVNQLEWQCKSLDKLRAKRQSVALSGYQKFSEFIQTTKNTTSSDFFSVKAMQQSAGFGFPVTAV